MQLFKIKEQSKLEIKPEYAFGAGGKPDFNIPPNAAIEYTVTLNNFEKVSGNSGYLIEEILSKILDGNDRLRIEIEIENFINCVTLKTPSAGICK